MSPLTADHLADRYGISGNALRKAMREEPGMPPPRELGGTRYWTESDLPAIDAVMRERRKRRNRWPDLPEVIEGTAVVMAMAKAN